MQGSDGSIIINGAPEGSLIEIYNVAGIRVASCKASGATTEMRPDDGHGIYVVRIGTYQAKVRL